MIDREVVKRARWQGGGALRLLKARKRDGGTVLTRIETRHYFHHEWSLADGHYGVASTRYAAQRVVRKMLREQVM
jgi:hypothetical protein